MADQPRQPDGAEIDQRDTEAAAEDAEKVAFSATTRRSAHSASSMPPATANPSTAAITGFDSRSRLGPMGAIEPRLPISRFLFGSPDATALRSAPAQKVPPAPVKTATDAAASASNARNASTSFRAVKPSTALRLPLLHEGVQIVLERPSLHEKTKLIGRISQPRHALHYPRQDLSVSHRNREGVVEGVVIPVHFGQSQSRLSRHVPWAMPSVPDQPDRSGSAASALKIGSAIVYALHISMHPEQCITRTEG